MNGFDVRALGWVVTRDLCSEIARTAIGGRPRLSAAMHRELSDGWRAVQASLRAERYSWFNRSMVASVAAPLSKGSETAIAEFVNRLTAGFPDLYGEPALNNRWQGGCATAGVSAAASAILAGLASPDIPIFGDAAFVMGAIACWSSVSTLQLWRTRRLLEQIRQHHSHPPRTPVTQ